MNIKLHKERDARLDNVNRLLIVIANCGRKFFSHHGRVSCFVLDGSSRVWFVDAWENKHIYTHYTRGRWRGFSEGGTLRDLVIRLRDFIMSGKQVGRVFGPFPDWLSDSDPWGYGADMKKVYDTALELGIIGEMQTDKSS